MSKSKGSSKQRQLFKTKIVPGKAGSGNLFEEEFVVDDGPVECLGMTFENDENRREYFLEKLREKLKYLEFRIKGDTVQDLEGGQHRERPEMIRHQNQRRSRWLISKP